MVVWIALGVETLLLIASGVYSFLLHRRLARIEVVVVGDVMEETVDRAEKILAAHERLYSKGLSGDNAIKEARKLYGL